jgi:dephospho-CoA kinase
VTRSAADPRAAVLRVALTGGIATGKSHCLARFAALGASVIDADVLAREAISPGTPAAAEVVRRFGAGVTDSSGVVNRAALAAIVFADPAARRDLEAIIHPLVYAQIAEWFASPEVQSGAHRLGIADIPLLYETGREADFDCVIVAACPPATQRERLIKRGLSLQDADGRIAAQLSIEEKRRRADHVIDTSGTMDETGRQVREIWTKLTRR